MEPELTQTAFLRQLEERLLQAEARKSFEEVASLLADEFVEFGSSGRVYNKEQVLESLQCESVVEWALLDFKTTSLAPGVTLVTYRVLKYDRPGEQPILSLRSSIWKWNDERWQMVFHQGTLAGDTQGVSAEG